MLVGVRVHRPYDGVDLRIHLRHPLAGGGQQLTSRHFPPRDQFRQPEAVIALVFVEVHAHSVSHGKMA